MDIWFEGSICANCHNSIMTLPSPFFFSFALTHIFCRTRFVWIFMASSAPALFLYTSLHFCDGMCSCCCLLFPIALFAFQRGDFGIAAELRCHGSGPCCRTVYTWDLESLSKVCLFPTYSTFLSGFLWCSRGYQHSVLPQLLGLPRPITLKSTLTYVMRHIYLKTNVRTSACASITLPPSFHLLISLSLWLSPHRSLSIPIWGFKYGVAGYRGPQSPLEYITVSSLL